MAVFTPLSDADVRMILEHYAIGDLKALKPISQGIENTNFFLDTVILQDRDERVPAVSKWVLTVFENLHDEELPFFNQMTAHLAGKGLKVPAPVLNRNQEAIFRVKGKSGVIVPLFNGAYEPQPQAVHCAALGEWIASMHLALVDYTAQRPLVRDLSWMMMHKSAIADRLDTADLSLLDESISRYQDHLSLIEQCPHGVVHGDLFRDNVLFEDNCISGVIDFYNASSACLLYDLAVAVNDWATTSQGEYLDEKVQSLIDAYQSKKPWIDEEVSVWPYMLELAALRFWISRLSSMYGKGYQGDALAGQTLKDPNEMKRIMLSARRKALQSDV